MHVPVRRLDQVSENTFRLLQNVKAELKERNSNKTNEISSIQTNSLVSLDGIPYKEAMESKLFEDVGMGLYKTSSLEEVGKIWVKKQIKNEKTGNLEEWLVVYTNDEDELIRKVASLTLSSAGDVVEGVERILQRYKIPVDTDKARLVGYTFYVDKGVRTGEELKGKEQDVLNIYRQQEPTIAFQKTALLDSNIRWYYKYEIQNPEIGRFLSSKDMPWDNSYNPHPIAPRTIRRYNNAILRGEIKGPEDVVWVKIEFDENGNESGVRIVEPPSNLQTSSYKTAADVNPKNIPIAPGIKSKDITMSETGGTQNAKVTVEFTDADKGLDFFQNLPSSSAPQQQQPLEGEKEQQPQTQGQTQGQQPPKPNQPAQVQGLQPQTSLRSTVHKFTRNGSLVVDIIRTIKKVASLHRRSYAESAEDSYGEKLYQGDIITDDRGRTGTVGDIYDYNTFEVIWNQEGIDYPEYRESISTRRDSATQVRKACLVDKYSFIDEKGREVVLNWDTELQVNSQFQRPDTGEIVRVGSYIDSNRILTSDLKINVNSDIKTYYDLPGLKKYLYSVYDDQKKGDQSFDEFIINMSLSQVKGVIGTFFDNLVEGSKYSDKKLRDIFKNAVDKHPELQEYLEQGYHSKGSNENFFKHSQSSFKKSGSYIEFGVEGDESLVNQLADNFLSELGNGIGEEKLKGGKGDYKSDEEFNFKELGKGERVEREHTDDEEIAKEIAKDHLSEDKNYYDKLQKMERSKKSFFLNKRAGNLPDFNPHDIESGIREVGIDNFLEDILVEEYTDLQLLNVWKYIHKKYPEYDDILKQNMYDMNGNVVPFNLVESSLNKISLRDMTKYVVKDTGNFYVDSYDVDTGNTLVNPGDKIKFTYRGKLYKATVTDEAEGRDDDVYLLDVDEVDYRESSLNTIGGLFKSLKKRANSDIYESQPYVWVNPAYIIEDNRKFYITKYSISSELLVRPKEWIKFEWKGKVYYGEVGEEAVRKDNEDIYGIRLIHISESSLNKKSYGNPMPNPNPNTQMTGQAPFVPNQKVVNPQDGQTYNVKEADTGKGMTVTNPTTGEDLIVPENQISGLRPAVTTTSLAEKLIDKTLGKTTGFNKTAHAKTMSKNWKMIRDEIMKGEDDIKLSSMLSVSLDKMSRQARALHDIGYRAEKPQVDEKGRDKETGVPVGEKKEIEVGLTEFPKEEKRDTSVGHPLDSDKGYRVPFKDMDENQLNDREHFENEKKLHIRYTPVEDISVVDKKKKNYGLSELESEALQKVVGIVKRADEVNEKLPPESPQKQETPIDIREPQFKPYKKSPPNYQEPQVIEEAKGGVSEAITKFKQVQKEIESLKAQIEEKRKPLMESIQSVTKPYTEDLTKAQDLANTYLKLIYNRLDELDDRIVWYEESIVGNMDIQSIKAAPPSVAQIINKVKDIAPEILEKLMKVKAFLENENTKEVLERYVVEYPISKIQEPKIKHASLDDSFVDWLSEASSMLEELDSLNKEL